MKIKCLCDPYSETISTYLKREFPVLVQKNDTSLLDILTDAIIASGQVRFGPKPSPESQVAIREIISHYLNSQFPIPFLVPWGSEKPNGSGIDIAEMMALKTLSCLHHRVSTYYAPGVIFNIRVEDASAPHLFFDRQDEARAEAARYTNGFVKLPFILGFDHFIKVIPESVMTSEKVFNAKADEILPYMEKHLANPLNEEIRLRLLTYGWKTPLSPETIGFYFERYAKLYPEKPQTEQHYILARYFSGALARHALGITGVDKNWGGKFLELSFTSPTPGIGSNRALRRLYYRTMPCSITSNHIPAWRAKGYLKINGEITSALASFNDKSIVYNPNIITLSNDTYTQDIQADYVVLE